MIKALSLFSHYQCNSLGSLEQQMSDALVTLSIQNTANSIIKSLERAFTGHLPLSINAKRVQNLCLSALQDRKEFCTRHLDTYTQLISTRLLSFAFLNDFSTQYKIEVCFKLDYANLTIILRFSILSWH